MHKIFLLHFSK